MGRRRVSHWLIIGSVGAALAAGMVPSRGAPARESEAFSKSGPAGSEKAVMQTMGVGARVDRVAVRPGSGGSEVWAFGTSLAPLPGWNPNSSPRGQTIFLRYDPPSGGWALVGPPSDSTGAIINPSLSDLAVSATGEAWAVGDKGVFLKKQPGASTFVEASPAGENATTELLQSVSLTTEGGATVGWAAGKSSTLLRYKDGGWQKEPTPAVMLADLSPGLYIGAVSYEEAWAVSDAQTRGVRIYHRTLDGWSRVLIGEAIFDNPPAPGPGGGYNSAAWGSSVSANSSVAWVGGAMRPSETPATNSNAEADDSRPFVVRITSSGVTTFCPKLYTVEARMCDEPFPTAAFDIPSIAIVGGEVFAGGLGLFHFDGRDWFREPDSNGYLVSISMASPTEGWAASNGNSYLRGSTGRSTSPYLGHFTAKPASPNVARWPQTQDLALEAVALSPRGSEGVAVGQNGAAIYLDPQIGWDVRPTFADENLHAAAWPGSTAWAVGDRGVILRFAGSRWYPHPDSERYARSLFGLAFRSEEDGLAVGSSGAAVRYFRKRWTLEPTPTTKTLYGVVPTPSGYLAVGQGGVVLEKIGDSWTARSDVASLLAKLGAPDLYAAAILPSGKVVAGGQKGALVVITPGGPAEIFYPPLDGSVLALASSGDNLYAGLSPDAQKYSSNKLAALRGSLLRLTEGVWRDISLNRKIRSSTVTDSSSFDDPVLGLAVRGDLGWAAGGSPDGIPSQAPPEGHLRSQQSGSIYRIDTKSSPVPKFGRASVEMPQGTVNFAVFGESWCGTPDAPRLCSSAMGTGIMADETALRIRDEINRAAKLSNGPRFVIYTGNMRSAGIPEELAGFKRYMKGFDIPVYAAIGDKDLYRGLTANLLPQTDSAKVGVNTVWKDVFLDMPAPWGKGATRDYIRPRDDFYSAPALPDTARTHYAFDVMQEGKPALRVAVLDSSTRSYGRVADQNPPEPQDAWLTAVVNAAKAPPAIPVVVVMNQPTILPIHAVPVANWLLVSEKTHFEVTASSGVTAVFAGGLRVNALDYYPDRNARLVPLYVTGGGGAPLGFEVVRSPVGSSGATLGPPTKRPSDGYYNAWHLVSVDQDPARRNVLNQAPHALRTFMTLESFGIHSYDGSSAEAGNPMRFSAFARFVQGGWSDSEQARATFYERIGTPALSYCPTYGQGGGGCLSLNAIPPPYRFWSEDPSIAEFVVPGTGGRPLLHPATRALIKDPDGQSGFICTFRQGKVGINVESGFIRSRIVVTVGPGFGPCINRPVLAELVPGIVLTKPVLQFSPSVVPDVARPFFVAPPVPYPPVAVLISVPGPIPAPAPPASAAGSRKEEEEYQHEQQGEKDKDRAHARAYLTASASRASDPIGGWLVASTATLMVLVMAFGAVAARRRQPAAVYVRWRIE